MSRFPRPAAMRHANQDPPDDPDGDGDGDGDGDDDDE
jgi:hypothetical protein